MRSAEEILNNRKFLYVDGIQKSCDGMRGFLTIDGLDMSFVASWGGGWDHVSVRPLRRNKVPTWEMMCKVKDIFFKPVEAAIQIHPPEDQYVNNMPNCLHLWRANDKEMVLPPSFMVGLRKGQTMAELNEEVEKYYKEGGYN